jgi:hypothetical protein
MCVSTLSGLSNCPGTQYVPGAAARICSSFRSERSTSLSPPGVKTSSAPYARMIFLRSSLMPSGITIVHA